MLKNKQSNFFDQLDPDKEKQTAEMWSKILKPKKTFGLAICGDVLLNETEVEIVDTPEFQRLRKIKQLGCTYCVYPSANHTRFEHSIGTLKKADLIIHKIKDNRHSQNDENKITQEEEYIIRLMALTHDICHMPFGHTFEDEFAIFSQHDSSKLRWNRFVGNDSQIAQIIKEKTKEIDDRKLANVRSVYHRYYNIVTCNKEFEHCEDDAFMYDIVSNTVCADLLDYLDRDSIYTGLDFKYHPRFMDYFFIYKPKKELQDKDQSKKSVYESTDKIKGRRIAIRAYNKDKKGQVRIDILEELIQLLRYRYCLSERVYYHHAKINAGTILSNAVLRAKNCGLFKQNLNINIDEFLNIYEMGDDELIKFLENANQTSSLEINSKELDVISKLAKNFTNRKLYEEIKIWDKNALEIRDDFDVDYLDKKDKAEWKLASSELALRLREQVMSSEGLLNRLLLEDMICDFLNLEKGDVLVYLPNFNMSMKIAKVKIQRKAEQLYELKDFPQPVLKDECKNILKAHRNLWSLRIFLNSDFKTEKRKSNYELSYPQMVHIIITFFEMTLLYKDESEKVRFETSFLSLIMPILIMEVQKQCMQNVNIYDFSKLQQEPELIRHLQSAAKTENSNFYKSGSLKDSYIQLILNEIKK